MKPALERIARALCGLDGHSENISFDGKAMWESYLPNARAVLHAIREPSEMMVKAGSQMIADIANLGDLDWGPTSEFEVDASIAYRAMIDASLDELG